MHPSWQQYHPSAFDTPEAFMQIEDRYVEIIGEPETSLSWANIGIIAVTALFSLGFSLFLAGDQWWYNRRCKIRELGIHLCTKTPAHAVSVPPKHYQLNPHTLDELCNRASQTNWHFPLHLPHTTQYVTDAACLTFLEQIKNKSGQAIERMSLRFKPRQLLIEQVALDTLEPNFNTRGRINMKFETAAQLHGLCLHEQWILHDPEEIASTLKAHMTHPMNGYYCLFGTNPKESDHHLLVYFQRDDHHYIFNPYQGILKLEADIEHTPYQLFAAYCQIQLRERPAEKLSIAYLEHT